MAWASSAQARVWTRANDDPNQSGAAATLVPTVAALEQSSRTVRILRRAIPILIVTFLSVLGIARSVSLIEEHRRLEQEARHRVAALITATAATMARAEPDLNDMTLAQTTLGLMRAAFPAPSVLGGATILISRNNDQVVASWPSSSAYEGRPLAEILGGGQPLTTLGARAGVLEVRLADDQSALAAVSHLEGVLGAVAVILPENVVLAPWRADLRGDILMFILTAAIIMLMTYAYFSQTARAEQASAVHGDVQARTETAFKRGRCGLWDWDLETSTLFWSASMLDMLGMSSSSGFLTREQAAARIPEEDLDLDALMPRLASGEITTIDRTLRVLDASGSPLWFRLRADVVENPVSGHKHLIGIGSDITEQHLQAEEDALADLRLRDAVETISEAFVLWDASNCLVLCNSNYRHLHNLADDDARPGTPYAELMTRARQPVVRTPVPQESHEGDGSTTFEAQIEDGRWLQINERRTKDGGFVSVGTDITQLKRHEERLVESEKRLLGTVMDLRQSRQKLELQAQQLVELAEKYSEEKGRAEEANRIKSDFLANISHELRTPLNAIIGFSEIMSNGVMAAMGPDKYVEYGRDIHASGQFLLNVINDILDMSRIEFGRLELTTEAVDLNEIAVETLTAIEIQAQDKTIVVASELEDGLVIAADRRAMKQVMMNLLSNAVKFTPAGGKVTLKARALPDAVTLSFEDTGIGIPADEIRRLGQPFVQVANQFTKTHKGSGLGLAIARSLVELHAGSMKIWSTEGVGTIISVRLPYHRPLESEPAEGVA